MDTAQRCRTSPEKGTRHAPASARLQDGRFEPLEPRLLLSFTEVSGESLGLPAGLPSWAESVTWADYNGDGWLDVYTGGTETFPPERPQYTIHPDRLLLSRPDLSKPGGRTFEKTWEQSTLLVGRGVTAASRTATWDFSGVIGLTAAWYTATLESNQVTGIVLDSERDGVAGGDYAHTFLIAKRGDTDLDGRIDIEDFNTLVMNFDPSGLNSGNNWSKVNFDRDSDVDISDFNQLISNFSPTGYALGAVAMTGANKSPATTAAESVANKTVSDRSPTDKYARSYIAASVEVVCERAFPDWGDFGGCGLLLDDVIAARRTRDPNQELADWMRR